MAAAIELPAVSERRIAADLEALSLITATPRAGITRLAYSQEEREAHRHVEEALLEAGVESRSDPAGNLIGHLAGRLPGPAVVTGSHLDTVRQGGRFDGTAGVVAGLECIRSISAARMETRLPIELVCFAAEESARFGARAHRTGSRAMAGLLKGFDPWSALDADGVNLGDAMASVGLDASRLGAAARPPDGLEAYLELHIEQGRQLARVGVSVGTVTAIVGTTRLEIEVLGRPDHSGGTPMGERRDALAAAAELVLAVERLAQEARGSLVATVGTLELEPASISVVPGRAVLGVDVRDLEAHTRREAVAAIEDAAAGVAERRRVAVGLRRVRDDDPTPLSGRLQDLIDRARTRAGIAGIRLASQTGHDATSLATLTEAGMIFVRNPSGRSHCPEEEIDVVDLTAGTRVLLASILELAGRGAGASMK
jgi:allantoate deiminase